MSPAVVDAESARRQMDRVLASPGFVRNERLTKFLRFVVERHLEGKDGEIKETVLAVEVFGRAPDHDPKLDSIVRTEAGRLRARLSEYCLGDGKNDELVIELPKGGYVPVIRLAEPPAQEVHEPSPPPARQKASGKAWRVAGISAAIAAAVAFGWWRWQQHNAPVTVAVLPLINLTQDPAHDFFADAITGELIRDLSILDGLVVRSQTSSFVFKGKSTPVRDAGEQLNVDYILEGSVMRADHRLRINAQLVRVRDDVPVWSGQYERELTDIFAIQDEISRGIVNSLRLKLGRGRRRYEASMKAYDLYLQARAMEVQRPAGQNYNVDLYEKAIASDPSFAPAYAGLGAAYAHRSGEDRMNAWATLDRGEEMARMRTVVAKAIELDPLLAEAHSAMGMVQARDGQWKDAEKSFRDALALEPNFSPARKDYVLSILWPLGRLKEALEQMQLAQKSDPLAADLRRVHSEILFALGRLDEGAKYCGDPCPRALVLQGNAGEAIPILEQRFDGKLEVSGTAVLGRAYALAGRKADAESVAAAQPRPLEKAEIFLALGDKNRALDAMDSAVALGLGPVRIGRELARPELASLRDEPRIAALRKSVGLPEK